jgi:hypothetical protein
MGFFISGVGGMRYLWKPVLGLKPSQISRHSRGPVGPIFQVRLGTLNPSGQGIGDGGEKCGNYFNTPRWAMPMLSRVVFLTMYIMPSA